MLEEFQMVREAVATVEKLARRQRQRQESGWRANRNGQRREMAKSKEQARLAREQPLGHQEKFQTGHES
jgi:hypothetical protein